MMDTLEMLPIRVRVASVLRKALLAGEFRAGQELSLTEIAARLGVSRTPVREAFQSLAAEGLLELRMNKGAVVLGIDEKFIRDHFDVRILLEGEAAARAALSGADISGLLELQNQAETEHLNVEDYRRYNQHIHTTIWKLADNDKLYSFLSGLWNGPSVGRSGVDEEHCYKSVGEHHELLAAIHDGDAEKARQVMRLHLERSMDNILESFRAYSESREDH